MTASPQASTEQRAAEGAARRRRLPAAWLLFLSFGIVTLAARAVLFERGHGWVAPFAIAMASSTLAIVAIESGRRMHRPPNRAAWLLICLAVASYAVADSVFYVRAHLLDDTTFPHPSDLLYLVMYPLLTAALLMLGRGGPGERRRAALLDGLVVGAAGTLLAWHFLLAEYADRGTLLFLAASFPVLDVVVLVAMLRVLGNAARTPALLFLAAAISSQLAGDLIYGWQLLNETYVAGSGAVDILWAAFPTLLGAAALHPSMGSLSTRAPERTGPIHPSRLVALAAAALLGPAMLLINGAVGMATTEVVVTGISMGVIVLVFVRIHGLVRVQQLAHEAVVEAQSRLREREAQLRDMVEALEEAQDGRARLLERTVQMSEHERMRMALELHDGPIQHLASIGYTLDRIDMSVEAGDPARVRELLEGAREHLSDELRALRQLMNELRPPSLDDRGVEAALRGYAEDFEERTGTRCAFVGRLGGGRLDADTETTLFRIAQETLTNVGRHARARSAGLEVSRVHDGVMLVVWDDGVGFDVDAALRGRPTDSLGLLGVRERVESADGVYRIRSRPGHGTRIEVTIPLRAGMPSSAEHHAARAVLGAA